MGVDEVTEYFLASYSAVEPLYASLVKTQDGVNAALGMLNSDLADADFMSLYRTKVQLSMYLGEVKSCYDAINQALQKVNEKARELHPVKPGRRPPAKAKAAATEQAAPGT